MIGLRAKEQVTLIHFKKLQEHDIRMVQEELVQKCKTLKVSSGEIKSLEKKEKRLKEQERFGELMELKKQKKVLVGFCL